MATIEDGITYFLYNKAFSHAIMTQWGNGKRDIGTKEHEFRADQLWLMEQEPKTPGYFYIKNAERSPWRVSMWGEKKTDSGVYDGHHRNQDLWQPRKSGDYYRFWNYNWSSHKFLKGGVKDDDWGTHKGGNYDDQLWKLVPRYEVGIREETVWEADNRQGSQDFSEKITVTTGMTVTNSKEFRKRLGFKKTTGVALTAAFKGMGLTGEQERQLEAELESTTASSNTSEWSVTREITFTAPAGKWYKVTRFSSAFDSKFSGDNIVMKSQYKIYEEGKKLIYSQEVFPGTAFDEGSSSQEK